jgi:hypothetical protein
MTLVKGSPIRIPYTRRTFLTSPSKGSPMSLRGPRALKKTKRGWKTSLAILRKPFGMPQMSIQKLPIKSAIFRLKESVAAL